MFVTITEKLILLEGKKGLMGGLIVERLKALTWTSASGYQGVTTIRLTSPQE